MFENILKFFKKGQKGKAVPTDSKSAAKERLHLVLMQDRANVSADFLDLMKQEIIEVIKKYIEVDEKAIDVRLTNKENDDGTNGAPALYANIPILNIKNDARKIDNKKDEDETKIDDEEETVSMINENENDNENENEEDNNNENENNENDEEDEKIKIENNEENENDKEENAEEVEEKKQ